MSLKIEKTDNANELKLEFTVEAKKFEEGIQTVFKKSAKYFNIPGFRKGKAPFHIVERTYGIEVFYEDAFNEIVPEIFEHEIKENKIEMVSKPEIDIVQMEKGKDLIFTAMIQIKPEVKLGAYEGVAVKKVEYKVEDADIKKELETMAEKNSRLVSVEDRAVKDGDTTIMDFDGSVDGVPFEGGKAENYELVIGSKSFIPGFEDQMIGMKTGEDKDVKVTFPEDYFSKDLAGKEAVFKVKVHEIKEKQLPEINDEFAKDVSEFETLKELEASIKEKLEEENSKKAKFEMEEEAIAKIVEKSELDIPQAMIDSEIEQKVKAFEQQLYYQGINLEQYFQITGMTMDKFKEDSKEEAEKSVRTRLVLEAVAKAVKVEAPEKAVNAKVEEMSKMYGKQAEEMNKNEEFVNYVKESIVIEETVKFIMDKAKVK